MKSLLSNNSLDNPTYTPTKQTKEKILVNHISLFCCFGLQKIQICIFFYRIEFLNCTSALTTSVILLSLTNAPRNILTNY